MRRFEYKLVAAPGKGEKARGAKTATERFALTLAGLMNRMGAEGWEYVRADTFQVEESRRFRGKEEATARLLVFRREVAPEAQPAPEAEGALPVRLVPTERPPERLLPERLVAERPAPEPERRHPLPLAGTTQPAHGTHEPPPLSGPRLGPARGDG